METIGTPVNTFLQKTYRLPEKNDKHMNPRWKKQQN